jgi:hypothetical protein
MSYYILKHAVDTLETGPQYPQVQKMTPGYDYSALNSVHSMSKNYQSLPDYTPNLDSFILHGRAKMTDMLSVAVISGGFLVSERFKAILESFSLPEHKFYQARLKHKGKLFEHFYWLHIICDLTEFVDYPASSFFAYLNYSQDIGNIDIISKEDYERKRAKLKKDNPERTITVWAKSITLTAGFDNTLDLFEISSFMNNVFISERLQKAIVEGGITGCNISVAKNLLVHP